jgi:hypothetical protein
MRNDSPVSSTGPIDVMQSSVGQPNPYGVSSMNSSLEADPSVQVQRQSYVAPTPPMTRLGTGFRLLILGIVALLLLATVTVVFLQRKNRTAQLQGNNYGAINLPLNDLGASELEATNANSLKINGQLQVAQSIVLSPVEQPSTPTMGQLYYDKNTNLLAYYNGQQYINVGGGGGNTTNVTNIFGGGGTVAPPSVRLQTTSSTIQQTGSFNVSGSGTVGSLKTANISSDGGTLYINPIGATAQQTIAAGTPATTGLSDIGSTADPGPGWANDLVATKITMGNVGGTAVSISVYFSGGSGSGHVQLGLYDDDGDIPSKPGNLLANSTVNNLIPNSWTTLTIPNVNLTANATYWLAVNTDDNTVGRAHNGGNKATCFLSSSFGFMPNPFQTFGCFYDSSVYSIYLNYLAGAGATGSLSQAQMVVGANGQVLFQNTNDSTSALQVLNSAGTSTILNVDSLNGRVGIGKANPAYKLDVAAGDINLSNGKSLRFGGLPVISTNGAGTTTSLTNFIPGGKISAQADNFVVQDADATHQNLSIGSNGAATFSNKTDSATAFQVQNSISTPLFTVDTTNMTLTVSGTAATFSKLLLSNSHFASTQTTAPTIGTPTNCGTTPVAAVTAGSTDTAGSFSITTGTGGTSSSCDTVVTFNKPYSSAPKSIIVVGKSDAASANRQVYVSNETTTDFTVKFGTSAGGANSTTYTFSYWAIE